MNLVDETKHSCSNILCLI